MPTGFYSVWIIRFNLVNGLDWEGKLQPDLVQSFFEILGLADLVMRTRFQ